MKKVGVAFYKGNSNWYHKLIGWWTGSCYSHSELVLKDNGEEKWLSVSPFRADKKVSIRDAKKISLSDWEILEVAVTEEQYDEILRFYKATEGCTYDWVGMIISQFIPFSVKHKNKWYCSEWVAYALSISGVIDWSLTKMFSKPTITPVDLYSIVKARVVSEFNIDLLEVEGLLDIQPISVLAEPVEIQDQSHEQFSLV